MKPFMHQATIDKMKIFGFNKDEWRAAILEEIERINYPPFTVIIISFSVSKAKAVVKFNNVYGRWYDG